MDWSSLIQFLTTLLCSGGVVYLIVDKLFSRKQDKANADSTMISNGSDVADLYDKIDIIVERKTAPLRSELADVKKKLEEIQSTWVCYKEDCAERIFKKKTKSCPKEEFPETKSVTDGNNKS